MVDLTSTIASPADARAPVGERPQLSGLRHWWLDWRPSIVPAAVAFLAFRLITEAIAIVSAQGGNLASVFGRPEQLLAIWNRWDAQWYASIVTRGYAAMSHHVDSAGGVQNGAAFPPLYPVLTRATMWVLRLPELEAATLVVAAAAFVALVGLHRLARRDLGQKGANLTLLLLLVSPASFFLAAAYAEGLLLACSVWCFLAARAQRWWLASALAGAAVLTKIDAVILVAPLAYEYGRAHGWHLGQRRWDAASVVAGPLLALAGWMVYLRLQIGDAMAFITAQAGWGHHLAAPWTAIHQELVNLRDPRPVPPIDGGTLSVLELVSIAVLGVAGLYAAARRWFAYAIYMLLACVVFTVSGTLLSAGRHVMAIFPVYMVGALLLRRRPVVAAVTVAAMAAACIYFLHHFATGVFAG